MDERGYEHETASLRRREKVVQKGKGKSHVVYELSLLHGHGHGHGRGQSRSRSRGTIVRVISCGCGREHNRAKGGCDERSAHTLEIIPVTQFDGILFRAAVTRQLNCS